VTHGEGYDEAYEHARAIESETGATFVHPFDDPDVIAGQGTIGMEVLHQHPEPLEALFLPVGGGGLAAGVATILRYLRPEVRLIGVEPDDAASLLDAFRHGGPVTLPEVGLFADGVAVRRGGDLTYRLCREALDEIVTGDTDAICAASQDVHENCRAIAEPAGAVAPAGPNADAARGRPGLRRARRPGRRRPGGGPLRREPELRQAEARGRARRARRGARGAAGRGDAGAAGQLPAVHHAAERPHDHRVQLPLRRPGAGADL